MNEIEKLNMIAEWQEQYKQLIEDLDNSKKRIAELEKENTELKERHTEILEAFVSASSGDDFEMAESAMFQKNTILINENDRLKGQLERLLKELIDRGIIYEWYVNGDGYHWSYTKEEENEEYELPEPFCEKHYRPFRDCDELVECWERKIFIPAMQYTKQKVLFRPEIWVKSKAYGVDNLITAFDNDNESIGGSCVFIQDMWVDMQELFDNFTFLDGSPVGKLEEK